MRFRTDGGSSWNITVEEAREKFKDFWSPPLEELIQSWLRMEVLQALRRTRATHGLMLLFEGKYSSLVRNKGRFLFHDVTRMLGGGPELKRDLQYRMYCRYDHWMLDEDTSQSQWRVIKPDDLTESKAAAYIKQSVYQWRGGDPAVLLPLVADAGRPLCRRPAHPFPLRPLVTPERPEGMDWKAWRLLLERDGYAAVMEELERRLARTGTELTEFHRDRLAVWKKMRRNRWTRRAFPWMNGSGTWKT